jgi:hypothetical protein
MKARFLQIAMTFRGVSADLRESGPGKDESVRAARR